jgi:hypothetical protein
LPPIPVAAWPSCPTYELKTKDPAFRGRHLDFYPYILVARDYRCNLKVFLIRADVRKIGIGHPGTNFIVCAQSRQVCPKMKQNGEKSMPLSIPQTFKPVCWICCKVLIYKYKSRTCLPTRACLLGSKKEWNFLLTISFRSDKFDMHTV